MVLLWLFFYPPYWSASYPGLEFLFLLSGRCHQQIWKVYSDGRSAADRKSRIQEPQAGVEGACWQPVEKWVSGKREIGTRARNTQPSAVGPAVLSRTGRWVGLQSGSSVLRIWGAGAAGAWGWCQGWGRRQNFILDVWTRTVETRLHLISSTG